MQIVKNDIDQLAGELENALIGKKQGDVITLPVGADLFPDQLPPQIEIVLLDPEENFIAYRRKSHPEGPTKRKGTWMIGNPEAVAGVALRWVGSMIKLKKEEENSKNLKT